MKLAKFINYTFFYSFINSGLCNESSYRQEFLSSHEGVISVLRSVYGDDKLVKVYSIFDIKRSQKILVLVNSDKNKCFVCFGGHELNLKYEINGNKINDLSNIFTAEITSMKLENGAKSINKDGIEVDSVKMEIGHWFSKPTSGDAKLSLTSSDGSFVINWKINSEIPDVDNNSK